MSNNLDKLRQFYKAQEDLTSDIQKVSPAAAGLAGWWLGGTIRDDYDRMDSSDEKQLKKDTKKYIDTMKKELPKIEKKLLEY